MFFPGTLIIILSAVFRREHSRLFHSWNICKFPPIHYLQNLILIIGTSLWSLTNRLVLSALLSTTICIISVVKILWTHEAPTTTFDRCEWWRILLATRVQTTLNQIRFTSKEMKMFFSRTRAEKGIAWHIDAISVVWTVIDSGKLSNQIARLVAIVVKKSLYVWLKRI